jgi:HPt (histidine-containing phosphotransfer) domain-containing protein
MGYLGEVSDLQERLDALRREYAATLPEAVARAREALERVGADGAAAIEEVWQTVHRIHGTAGSHGLEPVATIARRVEEALSPHRTRDALPAAVAESAREELEALAAQAGLAART